MQSHYLQLRRELVELLNNPSISPPPTEKELENKRKIMEYLKVVKDKIAFMDK